MKHKYITYKNRATDAEIKLSTDNLIKPSELHKHIGERLIFHNGYGYVVSGILTEVDEDYNKYAYDITRGIDYSHEMSMTYFYTDKTKEASIVELEELYQYLYCLVVQEITHDQLMNGIKYIALPTEEEQSFIDKLLNMPKEEITANYLKAQADLEDWENNGTLEIPDII